MARSGDDLSVLPLLWAWAAGVPVLAEESAPLYGLVEHEINGLVFPAGDLNAGCDRVARLHDNPQLAASLAGNGRALVAQRFSVSAFRRRLCNAYEHAMGDRRTVYLDLQPDDQPAGRRSAPSHRLGDSGDFAGSAAEPAEDVAIV
jgi:hypothetical protein